MGKGLRVTRWVALNHLIHETEGYVCCINDHTVQYDQFARAEMWYTKQEAMDAVEGIYGKFEFKEIHQ